MPRRRIWLLAALALAILVVGIQQLAMRRGAPVFPGVSADAVARIELARGRDQVVLARRADTGQWEVLSAAEAPGNAARIATTLNALAGLRGTPAEAATPPPAEPLEVRLSDASGTVLGHARLWPGAAVRVADGAAIALERLPALPLWQSAWADLAPPRIAAADIVAAHALTPDGRTALGAPERARVATMLEQLSAQGFVAAATLPWSGARMVQLTLADGTLVDIQQVPAADGLYYVRMTSDGRTDVRLARAWAFRTSRPLP